MYSNFVVMFVFLGSTSCSYCLHHSDSVGRSLVTDFWRGKDPSCLFFVSSFMG
jgi:hypothetical protein